MAFLALSASAAGATTVLLDTRLAAMPADMPDTDMDTVNAMEAGFMDELFDSGHIFFNLYTPVDAASDPGKDLLPLHIAKRDGAAFLIRLTPDLEGETLEWKLFSVDPADLVETSVLDLADVPSDPGDKVLDRWYAAGSRTAHDVIARMDDF